MKSDTDKYCVIKAEPDTIEDKLNDADRKGWKLVAVNGPIPGSKLYMLLTFERKEVQ